jgi:hypothetical protein
MRRCGVKRVEKVTLEILRVFDAERKANQVVTDTQLRSSSFALVPVRNDGWLLDEALCAAKRGGDVRQLDIIHHGGCVPEISVHFEGENATKSSHLLHGHLMVRVRVETGVMNARDQWVA